MLFYLAFYCHTLLSLVSRETPRHDCARPNLQFLECIQSSKPITASTFSNHLCELLTEWLVTQSVQQESDVLITKQQNQVLCYLFDCSLKTCSNQSITSLLTHLSANSSCSSLMKCFIARLPNSYFHKNVQSVIKHVSKNLSSVSDRPSLASPRSSLTVTSPSVGNSSSGSNSTDFSNQLVSERDKKTLYGSTQELSPSDSSVYPSDTEYEEKKELLLLVLQRINELPNVDVGNLE